MKKKRRFNLTVCELRYDMHYHGIKPCVGPVELVAGVLLCERHRILVAGIAADAITEGTYAGRRRHPVLRRRRAAA